MKKLVFIPLIIAISNISIYSQIKVNSTGLVKIGSSSNPTQPLDVYGFTLFTPSVTSGGILLDNTGYYNSPNLRPVGNNSCNLGSSNHQYYYIYGNNIYGNNVWLGSDMRFKENIKSVPNALDLILQLGGVTYDLKREFAYNTTLVKDSKEIEKLEVQRKNRYGFIAQDVKKILPSLVHLDDSTGYYSVDYIEVIPLLVEAIKEQNTKIQFLEKQMSEKSFQKIATEENHNITNNSTLDQNIPNPFNEATSINYYLDENTSQAILYIHDSNGKLLKTFKLTHTGSGVVTINSSDLNPGIYIYSLVADGNLIATKLMLLTI